MIRDPQLRGQIARRWEAVRTLCAGSHRQYMVPGMFINETPPESFYNLPLVLAFGILDDVLKALVDQQTIPKPKGDSLGTRMLASRNILPWQDYALIDRGRDARNDLAHEAKLLVKKDCFVFIDAIEVELKSWPVI